MRSLTSSFVLQKSVEQTHLNLNWMACLVINASGYSVYSSLNSNQGQFANHSHLVLNQSPETKRRMINRMAVHPTQSIWVHLVLSGKLILQLNNLRAASIALRNECGISQRLIIGYLCSSLLRPISYLTVNWPNFEHIAHNCKELTCSKLGYGIHVW